MYNFDGKTRYDSWIDAPKWRYNLRRREHRWRSQSHTSTQGHPTVNQKNHKNPQNLLRLSSEDCALIVFFFLNPSSTRFAIKKITSGFYTRFTRKEHCQSNNAMNYDQIMIKVFIIGDSSNIQQKMDELHGLKYLVLNYAKQDFVQNVQQCDVLIALHPETITTALAIGAAMGLRRRSILVGNVSDFYNHRTITHTPTWVAAVECLQQLKITDI